MKILHQTSIVIISAAAMTMTVAMIFASPVQALAGGTDILHFTAAKAMTDTGVESNSPDGLVVASQKEQGKANNQKLSILLVGLAPETDYELMATIDTDTNIVDIGPVTTDKRGRAVLDYTSLGHGHGGGKHHTALPGSFDPVSLIREVDVYNTNADAVLTADLSHPDKLQYLIKRNLANGDAKGTLMIHATTRSTQFRLFSKDLTPNTDYLLAFNGEVVQTNTTDAKGRLNIHSLSDVPPYILDVRSVELWDVSSNMVFETDLP